MAGKGSGRLHARQQCTDEEMQKRWARAFGHLEGGKVTQSDTQQASKVDILTDRNPDALAGNGDTFEEKVSLSDEMQLHGDKHKPEGL